METVTMSPSSGRMTSAAESYVRAATREWATLNKAVEIAAQEVRLRRPGWQQTQRSLAILRDDRRRFVRAIRGAALTRRILDDGLVTGEQRRTLQAIVQTKLDVPTTAELRLMLDDLDLRRREKR